MTVFRTDFATDDPELVEDLIRQAYTDQRMSISGVATEFEFVHHAAGVTGPGSISINRWSNSMDMRFVAEPIDDVFITETVHHGAKTVFDSSEFDDLEAGPGQLILGPTIGGFRSDDHHADSTLCVLDRTQVAQHAAARCGIAPEALRFTHLTPISPSAVQLWVNTVAHVRDDILADPDIAVMPMVLDSAFQTLATTLLATFPNTALNAVNDPLARPARKVSASTMRDVLELVHEHADEPIGPSDVAEVAQAPARDVDDALRRQRNTTLALELWHARMRGAYRDLHDGSSAAGDTVAAIATRWGFTNPARFAVAYRTSTGGETPDDTLRR